MTEHKIIIRNAELRAQVEREQARILEEEDLELSMAQTAARFLRIGLRSDPRFSQQQSRAGQA